MINCGAKQQQWQSQPGLSGDSETGEEFEHERASNVGLSCKKGQSEESQNCPPTKEHRSDT